MPAPCFAFLFEDNPEWTSYYAGGQEIHDYIKRVATKYETRQDMKFGHIVQHAAWNESEGNWALTILDKATNTVENTAANLIIPSLTSEC